MRFPRPAIIAAAAALTACGAPPDRSVPTSATAAVPTRAAEAPSRAAAKPATTPAKAATPAKPAPSPAAAAKPATPSAQPATAKLDLKSLEQRLKETGAIGVMTKLSLKNQVDDLVSRFRDYHAGTRPPTLDQLRPSFDLLLMKVLSLLQDKDPRLASDIHTSRDAIWSMLADPAKLAQYT